MFINHGIDKANSVLDVGCGNGEKTYFISQHAQRVLGIDPDKNQIKTANIKFSGKNISFQVGLGESLNFPSSSFSLVLFNESFHHIPVEKQTRAIKESWRVLEPEGDLIIDYFASVWFLNKI